MSAAQATQLLEEFVYGLWDAHSDTVATRPLHGSWDAHLDYPRALQRPGGATLAKASTTANDVLSD